jgi:threonine dehydrogenase-like Zn-dependent dehydrogenase
MKAAVFHAARDIRIEDVPAPTRIGPRDVLARPSWCGICGTDLHEYAMGPIVTPARPHPLNGAVIPQILGHEFSAEVIEVGAEVTRVRVGDRVSAMPLLVDHDCYYCRRGLEHLCMKMACVGLSYAWGGLAELAVLPEGILTVLPDAVSDLQGAIVEPAAVAAYGVDAAHVKPGDSVLITGAGPIGALAALYAASLGARVFVSELNPARQALVRAASPRCSTPARPTSPPISGTCSTGSGSTPRSSAPATSAPCRPRWRRCARPAASRRPDCTPGPPRSTPCCSRSATSPWSAPGATRSPTSRASPG